MAEKFFNQGGTCKCECDGGCNGDRSKCTCQEIHHAVILPSGNTTTAAKRNVISRYHLDTSVSSQPTYQKKTSVSSKYSCKGGYLSDGDSPELIAKSSKYGFENKFAKGKDNNGG